MEFGLTLTGRARGFAAWSTMLKTTEKWTNVYWKKGT